MDFLDSKSRATRISCHHQEQEGSCLPSGNVFLFLMLFSSYLPLLFSVSTKLIFLQRRKTGTTKPRDASTAHGATAAESVRTMLKKNPKYSKRINYDALKDLFVESGGPPSLAAAMGLNEDKDDADLYQMGDDKSDSEMVIIEEAAGTVAAPVTEGPPIPGEGELDADGEVDEGSDGGGEVVSWEDAYEQEI